MALIPCPTCEKVFEQEHSNAMPFCSKRCQQLDLGRWFNEDHSVPHLPSQEEFDEMLEGEMLED